MGAEASFPPGMGQNLCLPSAKEPPPGVAVHESADLRGSTVKTAHIHGVLCAERSS